MKLTIENLKLRSYIHTSNMDNALIMIGKIHKYETLNGIMQTIFARKN